MFWKTYIKPDTDPIETIVRAVQIKELPVSLKLTNEQYNAVLAADPHDYLVEDMDRNYKGHGPIQYDVMPRELFELVYVPFDAKDILSGGWCK